MLARLSRSVVQRVVPLGRRTMVRSFAGKASEAEYNPWEELSADKAKLSPPLELHSDMAQYAHTAFLHGNSAGSLDAVEKDLAVVGKVLEDSNTRQYFEDPSVTIAEKQTALDAIVEEGKLSEVTGAILSIVNDDGKIQKIGEVSDAFAHLMAAQRGEVRATVTSAEPLSKKDAKAVETALTKRLEKGQTLVLDQTVDPNILGGLLVEFGNEFADLSVRSSVEDINQALRE